MDFDIRENKSTGKLISRKLISAKINLVKVVYELNNWSHNPN